MENNEIKKEKKNNSTQQIAGAIIIAGVLVAGAILLKGQTAIAPILGTSTGKSISKELGLNKTAFSKCRAGNEAKKAVQADQDDGTRAGIKGTPYTVLITKDGKKFILNGAYPYENVKTIIDGILAGTAEDDIEVDMAPVTQNDFIRGNFNADIIAVEYSDPECPFCKKFHLTMQEVIKNYNGKIAWVYRHFPLDSLHQKARAESEAIECAGILKGNEVFWKYLDRVLELTTSNDGLDLGLL